MKLDAIDLRVLGISTKEAKILTVLSGLSHARVVEVGRAANIPRTTAFFHLEKLRERGLAGRLKINNHFEWQIIQSGELLRRIRRLKTLFERPRGRAAGEVGIGIEVVRGQSALRQAHRAILNESKHSRPVLLIGAMAAQAIFSKIARLDLKEAIEKIKDRDITLEIITGEFVFEELRQKHARLLESAAVGDRLVCYLIPDDFISGEFELLMLKKKGFIMSSKEESVVELRNETILSVVTSLLKAVKAKARQVSIGKVRRKKD